MEARQAKFVNRGGPLPTTHGRVAVRPIATHRFTLSGDPCAMAGSRLQLAPSRPPLARVVPLALPAGELLRTHAAELRRELPVFVASEAPAGSSDPQDRVMLRGRIDVLIADAPGGAVVIDYKTDRIPAEQAPRRAETYALQTEAYRQAVMAITGRPPREMLLVFLHPRVVHRI